MFSIKSFKTLNGMTIYTLLNPENKILIVK